MHCHYDMDLLDKATLTAQDKFLLMCIQRIEQLESDYDKLQLKLRDIACVHSKPGLAIDMLAYFLGVPVDARVGRNNKEMIMQVLPMYKHNWTPRLTDLSKVVPYLKGSMGYDRQ